MLATYYDLLNDPEYELPDVPFLVLCQKETSDGQECMYFGSICDNPKRSGLPLSPFKIYSRGKI